MSSSYYAMLTDAGAALEATALATGVPVTLAKFVVGDGNGAAVVPDPARTALVHEVYRGDITSAVAADNQVTFTLDVPSTVGGFTLREAGILTDTGVLYSLSNSPDILKPDSASGAVISITFKYVLAVASTTTVSVTIYSDYLTPDAGDAKYLQISKDLSEIKAAGTGAQKSARDNLGLTDSATAPVGQYLATANELSEIKAAGSLAQQAARKNINAVSTVNRMPPDVNGNVNVDAGGIADMRLGAEYSTGYAGGAARRADPGGVLIGLQEDGGDNEIHLYIFKPIQVYVNGVWATITG